METFEIFKTNYIAMQGLQGSLSCWDGISKAEGVDLLAVDSSTVLKHTLNLGTDSVNTDLQ